MLIITITKTVRLGGPVDSVLACKACYQVGPGWISGQGKLNNT